MPNKVIDDVTFDKVSINELDSSNQYNDCMFKNCDFSNANLNGFEFTDCRFEFSNLSMTKLDGATLNDVKFSNCKLMGIDFGKCATFLFSVSFEKCILNYALFQKNNLKKTLFKSCTMHEMSFIETNLTEAVLKDCDLLNSTFDHTNLEKADLSTARNYIIDPLSNRLKKTKFSLPDVVGLLAQHDIVIV
jgi:uncharacterized protein YjbI with pentapeptide repeats